MTFGEIKKKLEIEQEKLNNLLIKLHMEDKSLDCPVVIKQIKKLDQLQQLFKTHNNQSEGKNEIL